jgi:hypothetical protein
VPEPAQLAKHSKFDPTAAQSGSVRQAFEQILAAVEQPASDVIAMPRHERPAAHSPSFEQPLPAGARELPQASAVSNTKRHAVIRHLTVRGIDTIVLCPCDKSNVNSARRCANLPSMKFSVAA